MTPSFLPDVYQVTPNPSEPPEFELFLSQLRATLNSGIKLVQLRAKQTPLHERIIVARKAVRLCHDHGAMMILNGTVDDALQVGCDGVHLVTNAMMQLSARPTTSILVSAACHSAEHVAHADRLGLDFVTLSPVLHTLTHPESTPIGWERFAQIVAGARIPVFALGGMTPDMLDTAKRRGAHGIAAIRATWRTDSVV